VDNPAFKQLGLRGVPQSIVRGGALKLFARIRRLARIAGMMESTA
jgi:hypothetical protein